MKIIKRIFLALLKQMNPQSKANKEEEEEIQAEG